MPKQFDNKTLAYNAAVEASSRHAVGFFIEAVAEDEGVTTYLYEGKLKGYVGWRWSISVYQAEEGEAPTISEVLLVPGPESLVAPDWIPWSERLADYKALQAELEAQAALDAEENDVEDVEEEVESEEDDVELVDALDPADELAEDADAVETSEELATADVEEGVEAEADAGKTRKRPRFLRRRNRGAGKKKNDES